MNGFSTVILKMVVGHCAQNVGWNGIQSSSLDLLTEVLQKYLVEMGSLALRYAEQFGRTEPNLDDVGLVFREMGITVPDLLDYVSNVEPAPFPQDIPRFPIPREDFMNFLKPGSHEILSRPVHIYEYMPPMHQIVPDEEPDSAEILDLDDKMALGQDSSDSPVTGVNIARSAIFKRPDAGDKTKGVRSEEEGQPWREITSVMMTTSGFLSSSREGKLPESRITTASFLDTDLPTVEKKVNMKKVIEGIKKTDEATKNIKETKETEALEKLPEQEKEKEKEKEKDKAKKKKMKVLEEFAFFESGKQLVSNKVALPSESKASMDSTKQKLNIFRKIPKTKEIEGSSVEAQRPLFLAAEPSSFESNRNEGIGQAGVQASQLLDSETMAHNTPTTKKMKMPKKERKSKASKDLLPAEFQGEEALPVKESKVVTMKTKSSPWISTDDCVKTDDLREPIRDKDTDVKSGYVDSSEFPKKKRGRPNKVPQTPEPRDHFPTQSADTPCFGSGLTAPPVKPFFPPPSHFPVPGLIPPPLFQNVPFNLLGMPLGLRPPVSLPLPTMGHTAPNLPPAGPTPSFFTPPRNDSTPKTQSSVKKTSPNIVDSLPEAAAVLFAGPSSASNADDEELTVKKEKRDKKEKEKKKKEKKLKDRDKSDDTDKKLKRDKKKEKKDKTREKEEGASTVPKITFKFGAAPFSPAPRPQTPESTPKLVFKPMADRETTVPATSTASEIAPSSPTLVPVDVAKFSALVTRPPKTVKPIKKEVAAEKPAKVMDSVLSPVLETGVVPSTSSAGTPRTPSPSQKIRKEKPHKPPKVTKDKEKEKRKLEKPGDVAVITETVGSYYDEFGNKIWICPACGRQDDGTPMIGCDECDDWYHWVCVGIRVPPAETESWFCQRCIAKKQGSLLDKKKGRKKKSV